MMGTMPGTSIISQSVRQTRVDERRISAFASRQPPQELFAMQIAH